MISRLNEQIAREQLPLARFDEKGFSVTTGPFGTLFALYDEPNNALRLYAEVLELTDAIRSDAGLLLRLLAFSGPAAPSPFLRVGTDLRGRFLWASASIDLSGHWEEGARRDVERFIREYRELIERLSALSDKGASEPHVEASALAAGALDLPQVIWG